MLSLQKYHRNYYRNKYILKRIFLLSIFSCLLKVSFPQSPILEREIQFTDQTVTVHKFLNDLGIAGGFTFSYGQDVPLKKEVHIKPERMTVRKHLEYIFAGDSLQFIEKNNKILIIPANDQNEKVILKQTIKGRILDLDSKSPLAGVNIILGSDGPITGAISDINGYFRFENVPVGRHDLKFSFIGYKARDISNFMISSGKEYVVSVEMEESVVNLSEVTISSRNNKTETINDIAVVSGRSFSAEEIETYPGSLSDLSRTALSFPGVVSTNDGQNYIVIRGNSPKGLQWRLEGVEIPNLNHFSDIGASGGGVSVISNNMIAGSDFLTSAFPAEYGNALSGVFDLRLRAGNNEKHEQTIQAGILGTELMVEGPLKKSTNTTYIAQYRYSTLRLAQRLGVPLQSVPDFQDLSFKLYHPTKKLGVFSIFGIGGLSHEEGESGYVMNSNIITVGITNSYTVNLKTNVKSVISFSGWKYTWDEESNIGTDISPIDYVWKTSVSDLTAKASLTLNRKINAKHKIKAGIIYEQVFDNSFMGWNSDTLFSRFSDPADPGYMNLDYKHIYADANENAGTLQAHLNWKYYINKALTLNTGVHYMQFYLNNNYSIEPRIGLQWHINPRHIFSAGFGIHSRKESMTLYTGKLTLHDGAVIQPNKDLELTKARHYVLAYNFMISKFMHLKTELYYQYLYDIPAYPFPPYFSTINFDFGFEGNILVNYGTAYNKGIELTLEKYISDGYFFILNGSLYDSKYRNKPGELLHTKYDGSYATNGLFGREFRVGKEKQNIITISTRCILIGGMRYLPVDREQSIAQGYQVKILDNGFTEKASDYFRFDLQFRFKRNKPRYCGEWSLDIMNVTNHKNMLIEYWDNGTNSFKNKYQNPIIPLVNYRIQF
jgi:outer membrane receptor protein involved in Fe transport